MVLWTEVLNKRAIVQKKLYGRTLKIKEKQIALLR